jgi:hypothetical protein
MISVSAGDILTRLMYIRFSGSNAARLYDMSLAGDYLEGSTWPLRTKLTGNNVWDAFTISSLLGDHE